MFYKCTSLTSLDLSSFNTDSVKSMREMFKDCTALTTIYASDKFVTTSVTDGADMFKGCTALKGAIEYDASKTDHSYANFDGYFRRSIIGTGMYAEFDSAAGVLTFKNGDIHDGNYPVNEGYESPAWLAHSKSICKVVFDPSVAEARPTSCYFWFYACNNLTDIEGIEYLNTDSVTNMRCMFIRCNKLNSIDVSKFNTENVTDMSWMFHECHGITSLDVSNFNTAKVTDMSWMFSECPSLTTIYASELFDTSRAYNDMDMFTGSTALKGAIEYDVTKTNSSYANYTTGYFTLKLPTSIDAINGNDKAEYFDINGKRGTKLQRGINLVRRGSKTYKVVVK